MGNVKHSRFCENCSVFSFQTIFVFFFAEKGHMFNKNAPIVGVAAVINDCALLLDAELRISKIQLMK